MGDRTAIQWTDATWSVSYGCTKVSQGCKNCFAERTLPRLGKSLDRFELAPDRLDLPFRWKRPRMVFVNSMSDLFHESVPDEFIVRAFTTMMECPQHTFQVLTKRAERMHAFFAARPSERPALPNVWLGVSVENQAAADERIPHLLATPAAVRFASCEPLLSHVHLRPTARCHEDMRPWLRPDGLSWVICGGESGPKARPCDVEWIRSILAQCRAADVPAFVKQLGANVEDRNDAGFDGEPGHAWPEGTDPEFDDSDPGYQGAPVRVRLRDRKGGDPSEWPADLRVREFPR